MEDRLSSMTQKMLDLQVKYLDLQVKSAEEVSRLHQKVNQLTDRDLQRGTTRLRVFKLVACAHAILFYDLAKVLRLLNTYVVLKSIFQTYKLTSYV